MEIENFIPAVVAQHAEEAVFLWLLRGRQMEESCYLIDITKTDNRIEAHFDGLRIAGNAGWMICEEQLVEGEEAEVFAAAVMALELGNPESIAKLLSIVEEYPENVCGVVTALGWMPLGKADVHIRAFMENSRPLHQQIGIAAAAVHRWHPAASLGRLMASEHATVRARALRAAGELGGKWVLQDLLISLRDPDHDCVYAAAWSGALLGLPACSAVLLTIAESTSPHAAAAADLALRRLDNVSALAWHDKIVADPARIRLAIRSAGTIRDPSLIPWLISLMDQLPLARLAGESFTMIAGVDLAYRDLEPRSLRISTRAPPRIRTMKTWRWTRTIIQRRGRHRERAERKVGQMCFPFWVNTSMRRTLWGMPPEAWVPVERAWVKAVWM